MENFQTSKFGVRMSREAYSQLKRYLVDRQLPKLLTFVQEKIYIDGESPLHRILLFLVHDGEMADFEKL